MNIVLIGMRGAGKTTVGRLLAERLNRDFIEMDFLVSVLAGMPIAEIVKKHGWDRFRDLEAEAVADLADQDNKVIATGGGVVVRPKNIELLKKSGTLVLLEVSVETLLERIGDDENRPSLTGKPRQEDIKQTAKDRELLYKNAADITIETENRPAKEVAEIILKKLEAIGHAN